MKPITLLYDADQKPLFESDILPHLPPHLNPQATTADAFPALEEGQPLWLWLGDESLRQLLPLAARAQCPVAILAHPQLSKLSRALPVPVRIDALTGDDSQPRAVDMFYCNEQLVFNSVTVGDPVSLQPRNNDKEHFSQRWSRFFRLARSLGKVRLRSFTLCTEKDKTLDTAALGIVAVNLGEASTFTRRVIDESRLDDQQLNLLILSPRSVMEALCFLLASILLPFRGLSQLPGYLGLIKSRSVTIECAQPISYTVDGVRMKEQRIALRVEPGALQLLGVAAAENGKAGAEAKEVFRVQGLPVNEAKQALLAHPLPWIHHASTEEFKDLFLALKENARASESYLMLMVLSTLLALMGLFSNSGPVIIGAMILAPLMSPIISMAMGVLRQDQPLMQVSGRALFYGVGLALLCGTLTTWATPLQTINEQIAARLSPTLLDLAVAIISGVAGAYAHARSEVAKSLAGVAIAVALVPPLAVAGIGIGWFDWSVFSGAFLLFLTNLAGIVLAAALTFLAMGFSAFSLARKGLVITLLLVVFISLPLGVSFVRMVDEHSIIAELEGSEIAGIGLQDIKARRGSPLEISAQLLSAQVIDSEQIDQVKHALETQLGRQIRLHATPVIVR